MRWADACVGDLKVQQVVEVLEPQSTHVAYILGRKFQIKPYIRPLRVVKELAVNGQLGFWPDIFDEQTLAPAMVGNDHIRLEPGLLHLQGRLKASLASDRLGLKVCNPRVHIGRSAPAGAVVNQLDPLPLSARTLLHGHGHHGVALLRQRRSQKLKLPREVLVDEQNVHRLVLGVSSGATAFSTPSLTNQTKARKTNALRS